MTTHIKTVVSVFDEATSHEDIDTNWTISNLLRGVSKDSHSQEFPTSKRSLMGFRACDRTRRMGTTNNLTLH